jgi:hypothetical protein
MLRIGFASHGLNEDLFERGFDKLKAVDRGHGGGLVQELLRIAVRLKTNLGVAGVIVSLGDLSALKKAGSAGFSRLVERGRALRQTSIEIAYSSGHGGSSRRHACLFGCDFRQRR